MLTVCCRMLRGGSRLGTMAATAVATANAASSSSTSSVNGGSIPSSSRCRQIGRRCPPVTTIWTNRRMDGTRQNASSHSTAESGNGRETATAALAAESRAESVVLAHRMLLWTRPTAAGERSTARVGIRRRLFTASQQLAAAVCRRGAQQHRRKTLHSIPKQQQAKRATDRKSVV